MLKRHQNLIIFWRPLGTRFFRPKSAQERRTGAADGSRASALRNARVAWGGFRRGNLRFQASDPRRQRRRTRKTSIKWSSTPSRDGRRIASRIPPGLWMLISRWTHIYIYIQSAAELWARHRAWAWNKQQFGVDMKINQKRWVTSIRNRSNVGLQPIRYRSKNNFKIEQRSTKNRSKIDRKSTKHRSKIDQNRCLEGVWADFGAKKSIRIEIWRGSVRILAPRRVLWCVWYLFYAFLAPT